MSDIEEYLEFLLKRNRKTNTVEVYRSRLRRSLSVLEKNGMETQIERISEKELWFLVSNMPGKESNVRMNIWTLNKCIEFFTGENLLEKMDILWNRPKPERLFITNDEFRRMYIIADPKERMILMLGAAMGLRRSEIWKLKLVDIKNDVLTIRGKGHGRDGLVVTMKMPTAVLNELKTYKQWRSSFSGKDHSEGRLIVYKDWDDNISTYKKDKYLYDVIYSLAKRAGIRATPHSLRRLFCTELHENGCGDIMLSELMRHSSTNLLKIYINVNEQKKNAELEDMSCRLVKL